MIVYEELKQRLTANEKAVDNLKEALNIDRDQIKQKLNDLWLDESIMEPSRKDDYVHVEAVVARFGKEFAQEEFINERTVKKALKNMRELYLKIKGE